MSNEPSDLIVIGAAPEARAEDDRASAETNRIAAEGNRITAEGERVTANDARVVEESSRAGKRRKVARTQVGAYVLIVVVAAFGFYIVDQGRHALDRSQACTERFLTDTADASLSQSRASRDVLMADRVQKVALARYVDAQLQGARSDPKEQVRFLEAYSKDLKAYLAALDKSENTIKTPFPSEQAYRECVESSSSGAAARKFGG